MMRTFLLYVAGAVILVACRSQEREKELSARESELNTREQQLLLREKTLEFRELELNERIRAADSSRTPDSTHMVQDSISTPDSTHVNSALVGDWSVRMTCIETSCPGSAVGDTKTESWNLSYAGNHLVAKASDRGNLVRTYSGIYDRNGFDLIEHRDTSMVYDTRMVVRLRTINERFMEGQREIVIDNNCKIVYAVRMDKL